MIDNHVTNSLPLFPFLPRMQLSYLLHFNMWFNMCPCPAALLQGCFAISSKLLAVPWNSLLRIKPMANNANVSPQHKTYIDCQNPSIYLNPFLFKCISSNQIQPSFISNLISVRTMHTCAYISNSIHSCICSFPRLANNIISGSIFVYSKALLSQQCKLLCILDLTTQCANWL